jgi:hypothetical protein
MTQQATRTAKPPATGARYAGTRPRPKSSVARERLLDFARTMAWVVPLTLLIWIWAEREQLVTTPNPVSIPVSIRTNTPNVIVSLVDPSDRNVMAQLNGPRKGLDDAMKIISRPGEGDRIYIDVDGNVPPGKNYPVSADRIAQNPIFASRGITVLNATPSTLTYRVQKVVTEKIPIQLPPSITNLDGPATFEPDAVTVRGPDDLLKELKARNQWVVYADLTGRESLKVPGPQEEQAVPLTVPASDPDITFTPATVKVKFKVRQAEERYTYPSMPIWIDAPSILAERGYKVVLSGSPNLTNVRLVGTPDLIAALRDGTLKPKPKAHVEASTEDLPVNTPRTRDVKYELPAGITVAPEDARRSVEFRLQEIPRE